VVIFCQKCIKFHLQPSTFEKIFWGKTENPRKPCLQGRGKEGMRKGLKVQTSKGRGGEEKTGDGREGGEGIGRGFCSKVLGE